MPRILFVHGVSNVEKTDPTWADQWLDVIAAAMPGTTITPGHVDYDELFDFPLSAATIASAVWQLTKSGVNSGLTNLGDRLTGLFGRQRSLAADITSLVGWTAGMVVQWAGDADLRQRCRDKMLATITAFTPDIVCATVSAR